MTIFPSKGAIKKLLWAGSKLLLSFGLSIGIPAVYNLVLPYVVPMEKVLVIDTFTRLLLTTLIFLFISQIELPFQNRELVKEASAAMNTSAGTAVKEALAQEHDNSMLRLFSHELQTNPAMAEASRIFVRSYISRLESTNRVLRPVFNQISAMRIQSFLERIYDDMFAGMEIYAKEQSDISAKLVGDLNKYIVIELFVGLPVKNWSRSFKDFLRSISNRKDLAKKYIVVCDPNDITEENRTSLTEYCEFLSGLDIEPLFCRQSDANEAISRTKEGFKYDAVEVYGDSIACLLKVDKGSYMRDGRLDCRYHDLKNSFEVRNLVSVVEKFSTPLSDIISGAGGL